MEQDLSQNQQGKSEGTQTMPVASGTQPEEGQKLVVTIPTPTGETKTVALNVAKPPEQQLITSVLKIIPPTDQAMKAIKTKVTNLFGQPEKEAVKVEILASSPETTPADGADGGASPDNLEHAIKGALDEGAENAPDLSKLFKRMLWALVAFFRDLFGSKFTTDVLDTLAETMLAKMKPYLKPVTWETATPARISSAQKLANLHRPLRIVAMLEEVGAPGTFEIDDGGTPKQMETMPVKLVDAWGDTIPAIDVVGADLVDSVRERWRAGRPCEFLGVPVALPVRLNRKASDLGLNSGRNSFHFYVEDIRPSSSTLDYLGATNLERINATSTVEHLHSKKATPLEYLVEEVAENLKIVGMGQFHLLHDLLEFVALQALSVGRLDHAPARLNALIVGPPGRGKKLIGLAAKVLNPTCAELSAAKVSAAGLVGASYRTQEGWRSKPGALARAGEGVVWLQDAHGWSHAELSKIGPILQEVMEDGVMRDSVAGGERREAPAALLIDLNRHAHLGSVAEQAGTEAPLLCLRPLLSRVDLLVEIPADVQQAWGVAGNMLDTIAASRIPLEQQRWVRELKIIVALLRDRHATVEIEKVRPLMKEVFASITEENAPLFEQMPQAGDVPARLAISFTRLVSASARSRDSSEASEEDVARAVRFLRMKLEFLKLNAPKTGGSTYGMSLEQFLSQFLGLEVASSEIAEQYKAASRMTVCERTVRRSIQRLGGVKTSKGCYHLPAKK